MFLFMLQKACIYFYYFRYIMNLSSARSYGSQESYLDSEIDEESIFDVLYNNLGICLIAKTSKTVYNDHQPCCFAFPVSKHKHCTPS